MSTYAIGDVQGCLRTLNKLLDEIAFNPSCDRLIFLGDTINRGHHSLEVLRLIYENQDSMSTVLGNHDVYAIALFLGAIKTPKPHTLAELLAAPDAPRIFGFLRSQPLMKKLGHNIFVHAGILPAISLDIALNQAAEVSQMLASNSAARFLAEFYEQTPPRAYQENLSHDGLLKLSLSYSIFIRMCKTATEMDFSYKGSLEQAPQDLQPWFTMRTDKNYQVFFGHWAAIGYLNHKNYFALDAGCVWGNQLCAIRLEDHRVFLVENCEESADI